MLISLAPRVDHFPSIFFLEALNAPCFSLPLVLRFVMALSDKVSRALQFLSIRGDLPPSAERLCRRAPDCITYRPQMSRLLERQGARFR